MTKNWQEECVICVYRTMEQNIIYETQKIRLNNICISYFVHIERKTLSSCQSEYRNKSNLIKHQKVSAFCVLNHIIKYTLHCKRQYYII